MATGKMIDVSTSAAGAPRVVISNGLSRFHLSVAAAEAADAGRLELLLTGGYPTERVTRVIRSLRLDRASRIARLLDRGDRLPENRIESLWVAEGICQAAATARAFGAADLAERLVAVAFRSFARAAERRLRRDSLKAQIYHYRSGFELGSVAQMKRRGALALCDHSIAHPRSLQELVGEPRLSARWLAVLRDLEQADHVLVNSDFVKRTFVENGWDPSRIDVIYWGVDDAFLRHVRPRPRAGSPGAELRLLFAGSLDARKGVGDLEAALSSLDDVPWRLDVAGPVPVETQRRYRRFLADERVSLLGILSRTRLADAMAAADLFVFPTVAEGSARVVFEALAAGLFVITTPNAGSIVADSVHGAIVPPRSPAALAAAVRLANDDRSALYEVGSRNAELVRSEYTQGAYRESLFALYDTLSSAA